jgi:hypothetical protein
MEKARLDNFAIQLQNELAMKGYIVFYSKYRSPVAHAQARATRAKNYLINVRGLEAGRVEIINGGRRMKIALELYLIPQDSPAPIATPPLNPREVRLVRSSKVKANNSCSPGSRPKRRQIRQ